MYCHLPTGHMMTISMLEITESDARIVAGSGVAGSTGSYTIT